MKTIKIYTVIPYYSNGIDIFLSEIKSFTTYEAAQNHGYEFNGKMGNSYDIVDSEMEININVF